VTCGGIVIASNYIFIQPNVLISSDGTATLIDCGRNIAGTEHQVSVRWAVSPMLLSALGHMTSCVWLGS
jgi:hypothetical protein